MRRPWPRRFPPGPCPSGPASSVNAAHRDHCRRRRARPVHAGPREAGDPEAATRRRALRGRSASWPRSPRMRSRTTPSWSVQPACFPPSSAFCSRRCATASRRRRRPSVSEAVAGATGSARPSSANAPGRRAGAAGSPRSRESLTARGRRRPLSPLRARPASSRNATRTIAAIATGSRYTRAGGIAEQITEGEVGARRRVPRS